MQMQVGSSVLDSHIYHTIILKTFSKRFMICENAKKGDSQQP